MTEQGAARKGSPSLFLIGSTRCPATYVPGMVLPMEVVMTTMVMFVAAVIARLSSRGCEKAQWVPATLVPISIPGDGPDDEAGDEEIAREHERLMALLPF